MSEPKQFIRLSASERGPIIQNHWLAPGFEWPPPERLWVCFPHMKDHPRADPIHYCSLWTDIEPADHVAEMVEEGRADGYELEYTVIPFIQISCSKLDNELVSTGHVARGAEYIPEVGE